jgi:PAS domain S-box-containing protein
VIAGAADAPGFSPAPVSPLLLEEMVRQATLGHGRSEAPPWRFVIVVGDQRELLISRISEALGRHWGLGMVRPRGLGSDAVLAAPALLLAFSSVPSSEGLDALGVVMGAVQNLVLLARARGLATHRMPGSNLVPECVTDFVAEELGAEFRTCELVAMIAVGHPLPGATVPAPEPGSSPRWLGGPETRKAETPPAPPQPSVPPAAVLRAVGGERVVIVDPYAYNRDEARRQLGAAGYAVAEFGHGAELLTALERGGEPELFVISDALPDISGFELVRRIRARPHSSAALMMTTARRDSAFRIGGLTAGVDYYLRKPMNPIELLTAARILLDRRRLVAELHRLSSFQEALLSAMQDVGIVALDNDFRIRYLSPGLSRMVGWTEHELVGRYPMVLNQEIMEDPDVRRHLDEHRPLGTGRGDVPMRRKDGSVFDVELFRSALKDVDGKVTGYLGVVVDISKRKAAERELARANLELTRILGELRMTQGRLVQQAKMASLGQLVAGVAHEINTPLGAVVSNNDLFKRCFDRLQAAVAGSEVAANERVAKDLAAIADLLDVTHTACERITTIVRELRVFARLDEAEHKDVDLHETLESTLLLVAHLAKGRVEIAREYDALLPHVECHPNQLSQVFMNLIVNACQAIHGPGKVTLRTQRDGERVRVTVADTGSGISPEHLGRIFDPGFTTKGAGVGTGLGLSICYQIVEAHGGEISVDSRVGEGTRFTVVLPIKRPRAAGGWAQELGR